MKFDNMFMRNACQYEVGKADNGWVFGVYDIQTDEDRVKIASTPELLGEMIMDWQKDRVAHMIEHMNKKQALENGSA